MTAILGSIQIAKKTKAAWDLQNPTLLAGQLAAEVDGTKTRIKVGDGATNYATLKYITVKDSDEVSEGSVNLYYTAARFNTAFAAKTTTDLTEGTNLYHTQARVEAYVDTLYYKKSVVDGMFADAVKAPVAIDCSANPNYPAATKGTSYKVSVAGKIGGASGPNVNVGDLMIASVATAAGTHAAVGSNWGIYETNVDKSSEVIFGTARRATTAELTGGADDEAYVTSAKLRVAADARYLKLAGGTLTGALIGTIATFSGNVVLAGGAQINSGNWMYFGNSGNTLYPNIRNGGGDLIAIHNNAGAAMATFSITSMVVAGSLTTAAPSGGTAAAFKVGTVSAGALGAANGFVKMEVAGTVVNVLVVY